MFIAFIAGRGAVKKSNKLTNQRGKVLVSKLNATKHVLNMAPQQVS